MAWAIVAASALSAGAGVYGSDQAAKEAAKGGNASIAEQRRQFNTIMAMLEPQRGLGYGAMSDLATLYGYRLPEYASASSMPSGATVNVGKNATTSDAGGSSFSAPIAVSGRRRSESMMQSANAFTNSATKRAFGGVIDPVTGTFTVANVKNPKKNAKIEDKVMAYLRGETDKLGGKKFRRVRSTIDAMTDAGYTYDPNAVNSPPPEPTAGPITPGTGTGTSADGTAGNMSRFFTSPDYTFRLKEGTDTLQQSAAARGGLYSGNTGKGITEFAQNTAAGEYGNYVNRLLAIAGLGQAATTQAGSAALTTGANVGNTLQGIGDTRASGVMGATNSITGSINSGINAWLMNKYLKQGG